MDDHHGIAKTHFNECVEVVSAGIEALRNDRNPCRFVDDNEFRVIEENIEVGGTHLVRICGWRWW